MTPKQEAAMQMALEALTFAYYEDKDYNDDCQQKVNKAREKLREALAEQPAQQQEPVAVAMGKVIEVLQQDPEYAWGWHCNIAMAFVDAGGDHYTGNQGAARFMKMLANVEPAHELPSPPASKPWVGLTDDEFEQCDAHETWRSMRNVEAKLREKNAQPSKPLTDEQIDAKWRKATELPALTSEFVRSFARAIEAAHGIKGDA